MSVSYNRTRKHERFIARIKAMTISEISKLNPDIKSHKKILNTIKEYNIAVKP